MRFLLDECCDALLADNLREDGDDIGYIVEEERGATDTEVLQMAYQNNRILITEDKDFGELVYRFKKKVIGIILLRFSAKERSLKWHYRHKFQTCASLDLVI